MFQQTVLVGNLGSDVESRYTPSGVMVANFRMATNETWNDPTSGERKEKVTWWRVSCWRHNAENAAKYLTKGQRVMVVGDKVEARAYTAKSGELAASLEITAVTIKFLSAKGEVAAGESSTNGASQPAVTAPAPFTEEEIPF